MAVRELVLVLAVAFLCCAALVRPRIGLYGYVWFSLLRPDELAWSEGRYPFASALAAATLLGAVRYAPRIGVLFRSPITRWLMLLQVPIGLSVLFSAGPFLSSDRYGEYSRMILIVLLLPLLLENREHVRTMILVMAFSLGGLAVKFGLYGLAQGGVQFTQGLGDQYDNNTLGLAAAMAAPLCWRSASLVSSRVWRSVLIAMVCCATATAVMTNSRGASLALAAGFLWLILNGRRKFAGVLMVCLAAVPPVYLVRESYFSRMSTLNNYKEETSASSRIEFAGAAIRTWAAYPVFGVGFGSRNYIAMNPKFLGREDGHAAHNTYLQMLADSGCFAYVIYTGLLFGTVLWLRKRWRKPENPVSSDTGLAAALAAPLVVFIVGCTFGSCQRYDLPYMLLACAAALHAAPEPEDEETAEFENPPELAAAG